MLFANRISLRAILLAAGLLVSASALPAAAQTVTEQSSATADPNITLLSLPSATNGQTGLVSSSTYGFGTNNANTISFTGASGIYSGTTSNVAAAPWTPTGSDTASYLSASGNGGTATITYAQSQQSFNLLWGSVDAANTLSFYNASGTLVGTVTGTQVEPNASGAQDSTGSYYVDITNFTGGSFTKVVASTNQPAFEFAPAVSQASPAPVNALGTTPLAALVLAIGAALLARRHRRNLAA